MRPPPKRLLFLRPDTYGDLCLFEPVPRIVRDAWPDTEVAILIRERYADIVPLLDSPGLRWLTTSCDPYRKTAADDPAAVEALHDTVRAFAPDCVVAACTEQTWLEETVAECLPEARRVAVVTGATGRMTLFSEQIVVDAEMPEWEKNLRIAGSLLDREAPRWWPVAHCPPEAREHARRVLAEVGLSEGGFVACAAAGVANVQIKAWPAAHFGETLGWLEKEHGVRALLIGHEAERARLEEARHAARARGGDPALWTGYDGEMPVVAALLEAARFFFGNDTGSLHLAAALGRPVVSIFGGGHWPRFRPVAARETTVVQPLPCFECAWDCDFTDAPCVRTIPVASVQRALADFLASDAPAQTVFETGGLDPGARAVVESAAPRLRFLREDGKARLRQVEELSTLLAASEADRTARLRQVEELSALLSASEADNAARLAQTQELSAQLAASEADRAARLQQVEELAALLATSEADSTARLRQVEELSTLLSASEADRAARLVNIETLTALLHAERAALPVDSGIPDEKS